jgi:SulP family sulfate permease
MVAVYGLIDYREPVRLFRLKRVDAATLAVTFLTTLLVGIEQGIIAGVAFSLLVFVWRSAHPHTAEVGYLREQGTFRNVVRYPEAHTFPETVIARIDASLYFANAAFWESRIEDLVSRRTELRYLILDFSAINDVDAVAVEALEGLAHDLRERGIELHIAGMKGPVRDVVSRARWPEPLRSNTGHPSLEEALETLGIWQKGPRQRV